jgi:hypothetical protein
MCEELGFPQALAQLITSRHAFTGDYDAEWICQYTLVAFTFLVKEASCRECITGNAALIAEFAELAKEGPNQYAHHRRHSRTILEELAN